MHQSRAQVARLRRLVAIASAAVALLAMVAQPALAASGYVSISRGFTLSGDRNHVRIDARMLDTAPQSGLGLDINLGSGETASTFALIFMQTTGSGVASREIRVDSYGQFRGASGPGCDFFEFGEGGVGRLTCRQAGYDWTMDRYYRMSVVRGNKTVNGWLWTVNITDLKTGTVTKVVSFRNPYGRLSTMGHGPYLYSNIDNCAAVDRLAAAIKKPVAAGSTVAWESPEAYRSGCSGTTLRAPVEKGTTTLVVAQ